MTSESPNASTSSAVGRRRRRPVARLRRYSRIVPASSSPAIRQSWMTSMRLAAVGIEVIANRLSGLTPKMILSTCRPSAAA